MEEHVAAYLQKAEILAQLAEEAAELAQAALKMRRVIDGQNPTPVRFGDAYDNLVEEYSDVVNCMHELGVSYSIDIISEKKDRWIRRLKGEETHEKDD